MRGLDVLNVRKEDEDVDGRSGEDTSSRTVCELCQSDKPTIVTHGLRLCRSCENEYLP